MIMNLTEKDIFISANQPYLRPFLCKGNAKKAKVMLVGINPASPICPADIGFKEYLELCNDYEKFMAFYKKRRHNSGKPDMSRTRTGIIAFVEWFKHHLWTDVIETDICAYPTASYKEVV